MPRTLPWQISSSSAPTKPRTKKPADKVALRRASQDQSKRRRVTGHISDALGDYDDYGDDEGRPEGSRESHSGLGVKSPNNSSKS